MAKFFYAGDVYSGPCSFETVSDPKIGADWFISPGGQHQGRAFVEVLEVLPSNTGDPIVVYRKRFETPDGEDLGTSVSRKICRQKSLADHIKKYGLTLTQGLAAA